MPLEAVPEEFHFKDQLLTQEIGAASANGLAMAMQSAPELAEVEEMAEDFEEVFEVGEAVFDEIEIASTPLEQSRKLVSGVAGVGVTGASGAIDRITHEIMLSLEDRDTLVVWLFDRSGSLNRQRKEINERLERIYRELLLLREDATNTANQHQPLLTAVMAFGQSAAWKIERPEPAETAEP